MLNRFSHNWRLLALQGLTSFPLGIIAIVWPGVTLGLHSPEPLLS